jgi:hypothetical protein
MFVTGFLGFKKDRFLVLGMPCEICVRTDEKVLLTMHILCSTLRKLRYGRIDIAVAQTVKTCVLPRPHSDSSVLY